MDSKDVADRYYGRIGGEGLKAQVGEEQTAAELEALFGLLSGGERILDVACGYGRIAVPLALAGYPVTALDLSPAMVEAAREHARRQNVSVEILQGDLRSLPVPDASCDVVLCLWSSFNSLLHREEQLAALSELYRVLRPGGWALLDLPDGDGERWTLRLKGSGEDGHVVEEYFVGGGNAIYLHTVQTVEALVEQSVFDRYEVRRERFGGRRRLLVTLRR